MNYNRAEVVDGSFPTRVRALPGRPRPEAVGDLPFTAEKLLELFEAQLISRHLDLAARRLRARDAAYYTIGSCGHEGNVVVGDLVRASDPAFLHYRSGALMVQRARVAGRDVVRDTVLGLMAAAADPVSGGRHKVWGSRELWVPPQTSTIASHLPKAVGAAVAIDRGHRLRRDMPVPRDGIVLCSFGDASVNHSTAQGAFNAASWLAFQKLPVPVLFVCEDNGVGISVPTPEGWLAASMQRRPGIHYVAADGLDVAEAWAVAQEAVTLCRARRQPVFLHLKVVRLLGHAGSDIEQEYRTLQEIEAIEAQDPLVATAQLVLEAGLLDAEGVVARYEAVRERVERTANELVGSPRLRAVADVTASLTLARPAEVAAEAARPAPTEGAAAAKPGLKPGSNAGTTRALGRQRHLAAMINRALHEALSKYPEALLFGEDVARKGGVYHVTANLWKAFGPGRVFNTLLDEQSILGLAIGAAHLGLLPIPEIQYLAYVHNAEDQLRSEACSLSFFSNGQFQNPMVVRIASFAYQKGFGGHFHNDNSVAALRDIPGLVIAAPARGDEAAQMLRTCLALAKVDGRVVAFLEPIALYMTKDLHAPGDGLWLSDYPAEGEAIPLGRGRVYHPEAEDLTIVSYANGLYLSLQAAKRLAASGLHARVVDLRWLNPIDHDLVLEQARATGRLLVVDECRRAGGVGEAIVASVAERAGDAVRVSLIAGADTYLPLGPAMDLCLPSADGIEAAARALVEQAVVGRA